MTLDEAYRHIKASYIHHSQERNAVFLPQAELIAMECIEKCKQADTQHVKRGRWSYYKNNGIYYQFKCTNCNVKIEITISELTRDDMPDGWNFCPHCGARMDGDTE